MTDIVLITGATGFLGRALVNSLASNERFVLRAASRQAKVDYSAQVEAIQVGSLGGDTDWHEVLKDVKVVIHTAARVHIMSDLAEDPLREFRCVNVTGTLNLARQAAEAGTQRFVFISSIKVNGEGTPKGVPFLADTEPMPIGPYGISKMDAEQGLRAIAAETGMEVVIIRPPLVYGPGVKSNFLNMMRWLNRGVPLPLGSIHNKRSFVALDNLVDLIVTCLDHPAAANQTFLVCDGEDLSTTELLRRTAIVLGKPARLLPVPQHLLVYVLRLMGKGDLAQRLCGSLQLDNCKTRELLGWTPPVSVDEGLRRAVAGFKEDG